MLKRVVQYIPGVLLIPVGIGYSIAFYEVLTATRQLQEPELAILLGLTAYLLFHVLILQPTRLYVFGHEFMHAMATWMTGGAVRRFKVGAKGGSVRTNKVTGVIALAPYMVPIYTVLWALLYGFAGLFWNTAPWTNSFFLGVGFTLAFHLVFTVNVLKGKQTDLDVIGPLFSLGLIYWVNLGVVVGGLSLVIPEVRFKTYLISGFQHTVTFWDLLIRQIFSL